MRIDNKSINVEANTTEQRIQPLLSMRTYGSFCSSDEDSDSIVVRSISDDEISIISWEEEFTPVSKNE